MFDALAFLMINPTTAPTPNMITFCDVGTKDFGDTRDDLSEWHALAFRVAKAALRGSPSALDLPP
jgi:hypothetical protein